MELTTRLQNSDATELVAAEVSEFMHDWMNGAHQDGGPRLCHLCSDGQTDPDRGNLKEILTGGSYAVVG